MIRSPMNGHGKTDNRELVRLQLQGVAARLIRRIRRQMILKIKFAGRIIVATAGYFVLRTTMSGITEVPPVNGVL